MHTCITISCDCGTAEQKKKNEKKNEATLTTVAVFLLSAACMSACFAVAAHASKRVFVMHIGSVSRYLLKSA